MGYIMKAMWHKPTFWDTYVKRSINILDMICKNVAKVK